MARFNGCIKTISNEIEFVIFYVNVQCPIAKMNVARSKWKHLRLIKTYTVQMFRASARRLSTKNVYTSAFDFISFNLKSIRSHFRNQMKVQRRRRQQQIQTRKKVSAVYNWLGIEQMKMENFEAKSNVRYLFVDDDDVVVVVVFVLLDSKPNRQNVKLKQLMSNWTHHY